MAEKNYSQLDNEVTSEADFDQQNTDLAVFWKSGILNMVRMTFSNWKAMIRNFTIGSGGVAGQALIKNSATDFDASFQDIPNDLPTGGTSGQVLTKVSSTDFDVAFQDAAGGSSIQRDFNFEANITQNFADFFTIPAGVQFNELVDGVILDEYRTSQDNGNTLVSRADLSALNAFSAGLTPGTFFQLYAGVSSLVAENGSIILTEQ